MANRVDFRLAGCALALLLGVGCGADDDGAGECDGRARCGPGPSAGASGRAGASAGAGAGASAGGGGSGMRDSGMAGVGDSGLDADAGAAPSADFAARCAAPGVIVCRGFDDESELVPITLESETGAEADNTGSREHIAIDSEIKASGAGALRFEIEGQTGANHSGAFRQLMGQAFGEGEVFYAQFRLRLSSSFIDTPWDSVVRT